MDDLSQYYSELKLQFKCWLISELKMSLFLLKNFSDTSSSDLKIIGGTFFVQEYSTITNESIHIPDEQIQISVHVGCGGLWSSIMYFRWRTTACIRDGITFC